MSDSLGQASRSNLRDVALLLEIEWARPDIVFHFRMKAWTSMVYVFWRFMIM